MAEKLVIISPCRDEADYIEKTIQSMIKQTRLPDRWIIVNDGSTDNTEEIVRPYAEKHQWIELIDNQRTGERSLGGAVVKAFNYGLQYIGDYQYDIIVKLDCDLELPEDCIEKHLKMFEDPEVGAAGGAIYLVVGDQLQFERYPDFFVPGQAKFYRRACFEDIGGFIPNLGWDYVDVIDARRKGWKTMSDFSIVIKHHRLMGAVHGALRSRYRWGWASYIIGSHPLFVFFKGVYRMLDRPWIIGGLAIIWGFISSYFKSDIRQISDRDLIKYVRKEQLYRLFHGNKLPPQEDK